MLNGIAPVFLIYLTEKDGDLSTYKGLLPFKTPLPIYLDERTEIYVDRQHSSLSTNIDTIVDVNENNKLEVLQNNETQRISIDLVGRKNNVGLNLMLPLFKTLFEFTLYGKRYNIAYFNDNVFTMNARLVSFDTTEHRDNDLVTISITLETIPLNAENYKKREAVDSGDPPGIGNS
ncbi:hypothetical protein Dip510_000058 [Elusimicrobium posterum]|uniref:hypothetical protein n=1 Tax=Elusimicrobium posterum TaxID=3116653 RepID=UPI003C739C27